MPAVGLHLLPRASSVSVTVGSFALALILFDGWVYLWHMLNHKVPLLWRFHAVHHADRELNASSALRFHTGEIILSGGARLAVMPILGMTLPQFLVYEALLLPESPSPQQRARAAPTRRCAALADPTQIALGLKDDREERHWRTLPGMLARPFRRKRSQTRKDGG